MTAPAPQYVWIEVGAVVPGSGRDTLFGHGTMYGANPTPVDGEAQFDLVTGKAQLYDGTAWADHAAQDGDEYVDLDTGITYSLLATTTTSAGVPAGPQRTFVVSEADFVAGVLPAGSKPGDVVMSSTGGYARII